MSLRYGIITSTILLFVAGVQADGGVTDINIDPALTYVIDTPGSYRVVSDVTMTSDVVAVQIQCDDVTLDLGGHTLTGTGQKPGGLVISGVSYFTRSGIVVRNGRIRGFASWGILGGDNSLVEEVICLENNQQGGTGGISVGNNSIVRNCEASLNSSPGSGIGSATGIDAGFNCVIEGNTCVSNISAGAANSFGIQTEASAVIRGNVCNSNSSNQTSGQGSAYGIWCGGNSVIQDNVCNFNLEGPSAVMGGHGIFLFGNSSHVSGNVCSGNGASSAGTPAGWGYGIVVRDGSRVEHNVVSGNRGLGGDESYLGAGIYVVGPGTTVEYNTCRSNSGAPGSAGILISEGGDQALIRWNHTSGNNNLGVHFLPLSSGGFSINNVIMESGGYSDEGSNSQVGDIVAP